MKATAPRAETRTLSNGRPSWSEEAELSALGCLFLDSETARRVVDLVPVDALHKRAHRYVLRAARKIIDRGEQVDAVSLSDELRSAGRLKQVGGMGAVAELVDASPGADGLESWANTIQRKAFARATQQALEEERDALSKASASEVPEIVRRIEDRLHDLRDAHLPAPDEDDKTGIATAEEILAGDDVSEDWEPVADHLAWRGKLVMLAAREKTGKSTLLAEAAAAVTCGKTSWGGP